MWNIDMLSCSTCNVEMFFLHSCSCSRYPFVLCLNLVFLLSIFCLVDVFNYSVSRLILCKDNFNTPYITLFRPRRLLFLFSTEVGYQWAYIKIKCNFSKMNAQYVRKKEKTGKELIVHFDGFYIQLWNQNLKSEHVCRHECLPVCSYFQHIFCLNVCVSCKCTSYISVWIFKQFLELILCHGKIRVNNFGLGFNWFTISWLCY